MQKIARVIGAAVVVFFLHASTAQAMSFGSIVAFGKFCALSIAKKSGSVWMVRAARLTNRGTALALTNDYNQHCVRKYADVLNDSRADLLNEVIKNGDEEGVLFLLDPKECLKCYQGTEQDPTLLHVALRTKRYHAARILLGLDMDPNRLGKAAFSDQLRPPIVEFARDIEAVLLLLEFGADLDWRDEEGGSIYSVLFTYREWEIISLLHDRGLKLSPKDYLIAIENKDKLIEYELTGFLRELGIKYTEFPTDIDSAAMNTDASVNSDETTANSTVDKGGYKPKLGERDLKDILADLHNLSRKERLALLRFMANRDRTGSKTGLEKE